MKIIPSCLTSSRMGNKLEDDLLGSQHIVQKLLLSFVSVNSLFSTHNIYSNNTEFKCFALPYMLLFILSIVRVLTNFSNNIGYNCNSSILSKRKKALSVSVCMCVKFLSHVFLWSISISRGEA